MQHVFTFFFRLFLAFVAAKLLMRVVGLATPAALAGFTLLIVANLYVFDYLNHRSQLTWRRGSRLGSADAPPWTPPPPTPPPVPPPGSPPEE